MADFADGAQTADQGVQQATTEKQARAFECWIQHVKQIGIEDDDCLEQLSGQQKIVVFCAFTHAHRSRRFSRTRGKPLASATVSTAVDNVVQAFKNAHKADPTIDATGKRAGILSRQRRGMKNMDGPTQQQKAIPMELFGKMLDLATTEEEKATADLVGAAVFFACRSCECSEVTGERRTEIVTITGLAFHSGKRTLPTDSANLDKADSVSVTFRTQKNDEQHETVTQHRTNDKRLCPVLRWAAVVRRVTDAKGTESSPKVNWFRNDKGKPQLISSAKVRNCIRLIATVMGGKDRFGFEPKEIGTHSVRSAAAMAMCLAGAPACTIMLVGRWKSDSFLRCIRKQVKEFTMGVSTKMTSRTTFFTLCTGEKIPVIPARKNMACRGTHRQAVPFFGANGLNKLVV